ncbi:RTA1 domain protein, putative [Beauveria bassiana ARSEF 2860]|uniref:RTA1 domain protein, putative n=1 Tax=Beauveria bassiana (strain ARSEF 2860) TaxID=655819 RepID=J5JGY0_BEAB2|nr:RTA1 domain protein, putative [Beauveria bassiana ARSEF 2860]EJP62746.1 RTA1 domain protein, putative [Beauveria bassiana ARSEF 2860]
MPELKPYKGAYYLWDYVPSLPAAIVAIVLFGLLTSGVVWRSISTRTRFAIPFAIGGLFELIGYIARAAARDRTDNLILFILQSVFVLVAPALFAASIYMVLSRLARSIHGERHLVIPPRWLTRVFVFGDVFSFLVQSAGGGLIASDTFPKKTAQNIILAGLLIQIVLFGLFAVTAVIFHVRMRRWPSAASAASGGGAVPWERILFMMYTASMLIMVRSIFRVVEYIMGKEGYLLTHEWTLYVFDALLMVLTMAVFVWWYPGRLTASPHEWENVEGGVNESSLRLGAGGEYSSRASSKGLQK